MIRRAISKAVAIPGIRCRSAREMPMPYGWGSTGGIQITASVIGEADVLRSLIRGGRRHHQRRTIRNFWRNGRHTTEKTKTRR